jgi:DNA-binding transcriptional regulator YhcF (GntR family)
MDEEWELLIKEALELGITPEEIREFFREYLEKE